MARGEAKGKDGASVAAKGTLICGGLTLFLGFLGFVLAMSGINLTWEEAVLTKCGNDKDAFPDDCASMPSSSSASDSTTRRLSRNGGTSDRFLQIMESAAPRRSLSSLFVGTKICDDVCGTSEDVCKVDHKDETNAELLIDTTVTCTCVSNAQCMVSSAQKPLLTTGEFDVECSALATGVGDSECYGTAKTTGTATISFLTKRCCQDVCGIGNTLVHAKCSAESNTAMEECTCKISEYHSFDSHKEFCHDTFEEGTKVSQSVDREGYTGTVKCSVFQEKTWLNCGNQQSEMCGGPGSFRSSPDVQNGIGDLRLMGVAAGLMAMVGTTPPVIAAIAKLKGKESLETMCTMIGTCTTICFGFLGTAILSALLFTLGGFFQVTCVSLEESGLSDEIPDCNENCKLAFESLVETWCGMGQGLTNTSLVSGAASFFGLLTAIYSCISSCKKKKQAQVIVVQQAPSTVQTAVVPVAQAQIIKSK